jgi:predicted unusual protein kinase regulating ubiquinone biosynthesis (AarF/ABC1/UbiB family)
VLLLLFYFIVRYIDYYIYFQVFEDNFAHGDLHPGNILVREEETCDVNQKKSLWHTSPFLISKSTTCPVSIVILDCGIIASLDDHGKECLRGVFKAVANGDVSTRFLLLPSLCRKICTVI